MAKVHVYVHVFGFFTNNSPVKRPMSIGIFNQIQTVLSYIIVTLLDFGKVFSHVKNVMHYIILPK